MTAVRGMVLLAVLGLAGCFYAQASGASVEEHRIQQPATGDSIRVWHDDKRGVTCWVYTYYGRAGGISCIPDSQLTIQEARHDER